MRNDDDLSEACKAVFTFFLPLEITIDCFRTHRKTNLKKNTSPVLTNDKKKIVCNVYNKAADRGNPLLRGARLSKNYHLLSPLYSRAEIPVALPSTSNESACTPHRTTYSFSSRCRCFEYTPGNARLLS